MIKKVIAIFCVSIAMLSQTIFASDEIMLISTYDDAKIEFYEKYGVKNAADVFYNGQYISFEDVQPLIVSGTTFVPIRTFCDTLGATISFVDETWEVVITNNNDEISFIAGTNSVKVNGEEIILSAQTFIIDGRTMVPARLISEAFDLEVFWNEQLQQVSIYDVNGLKSNIDTQYNIINGMLGLMCNEESDSNTKIAGNLTVKVGELSKETIFKATFTSFENADQSIMDFDATCTLDTQNFIDEVDFAIENKEIDTFTAQLLKEYIQKFNEFELEIILDKSSEQAYLSSSITDVLGQILFNTNELDTNSILKISYDEVLNNYPLMQPKMLDIILSEKSYNMGDAIDEIISKSSNTDLFNNNQYLAAQFISTILTDANFTKTDQTYKISDSVIIDHKQIDYEISIQTSINDKIIAYSVDYASANEITGDTLLLSILNQVAKM